MRRIKNSFHFFIRFHLKILSSRVLIKNGFEINFRIQYLYFKICHSILSVHKCPWYRHHTSMISIMNSKLMQWSLIQLIFAFMVSSCFNRKCFNIHLTQRSVHNYWFIFVWEFLCLFTERFFLTRTVMVPEGGGGVCGCECGWWVWVWWVGVGVETHFRIRLPGDVASSLSIHLGYSVVSVWKLRKQCLSSGWPSRQIRPPIGSLYSIYSERNQAMLVGQLVVSFFTMGID